MTPVSVFISSLLMLISPALFAATALSLPTNHSASYEIIKYDSPVGEMHNRLSLVDGVMRYETSTTAVGLASLFVRNDLKEISTLKQNALGEWQQTSFHASRGKKHKQNQDFTFSSQKPGNVTIKGSYRGDSYTLQTPPPVWGRHMLPLLMSSDLNQDPQTRSNHFQITDKGKLHDYHYTLVKAETIDWSGQKLATLKFKIIRKGSNRISYAWLSKQHQFLPVKIEQYKDDDLNLSMILTGFTTK